MTRTNPYFEADKQLMITAKSEIIAGNYDTALNLIYKVHFESRNDYIIFFEAVAAYAIQDFDSAYYAIRDLDNHFFTDSGMVWMLFDILIRKDAWSEGWYYAMEITNNLPKPVGQEFQRIFDHFFDELRDFYSRNDSTRDYVQKKLGELSSMSADDQTEIVHIGLNFGLPFIQEKIVPLLMYSDINPFVKGDIVAGLVDLADSSKYELNIFNESFSIIPSQINRSLTIDCISRMQMIFLKCSNGNMEMFSELDKVGTRSIELISPIIDLVITDLNQWAEFFMNDYLNISQTVNNSQMQWYQRIRNQLEELEGL